ncbi:hypothetical protein RvY_03729 [Ramazzottius varieornatus]|uniref:Uncharacterized protein n=1 Tax=Ramazzottius varieornatus TaxID=947166 RepID=A0A1D1UP31_RAMVA|nr:hypothetical protein RvY_03729 [Ramazzottius varieornatus]
MAVHLDIAGATDKKHSAAHAHKAVVGKTGRKETFKHIGPSAPRKASRSNAAPKKQGLGRVALPTRTTTTARTVPTTLKVVIVTRATTQQLVPSPETTTSHSCIDDVCDGVHGCAPDCINCEVMMGMQYTGDRSECLP